MKTTRDYDFMISVGQMCRHSLIECCVQAAWRCEQGCSLVWGLDSLSKPTDYWQYLVSCSWVPQQLGAPHHSLVRGPLHNVTVCFFQANRRVPLLHIFEPLLKDSLVRSGLPRIISLLMTSNIQNLFILAIQCNLIKDVASQSYSPASVHMQVEGITESMYAMKQECGTTFKFCLL